ncbi:hypothetical protein SUDANB178_00286 [Streptomyces sp. enrichment culture]
MADDHPVVRAGLRAVLETEPGLVVMAEAATAEGAVTRAAEGDTDVVLMDLRFGHPARHRGRCHRAFGQVETVADGLVGQAVGDQGEDLGLAPGQGGAGVKSHLARVSAAVAVATDLGLIRR